MAKNKKPGKGQGKYSGLNAICKGRAEKRQFLRLNKGLTLFKRISEILGKKNGG